MVKCNSLIRAESEAVSAIKLFSHSFGECDYNIMAGLVVLCISGSVSIMRPLIEIFHRYYYRLEIRREV